MYEGLAFMHTTNNPIPYAYVLGITTLPVLLQITNDLSYLLHENYTDKEAYKYQTGFLYI